MTSFGALLFNKVKSMTDPEYSLASENSERSVQSSDKSSPAGCSTESAGLRGQGSKKTFSTSGSNSVGATALEQALRAQQESNNSSSPLGGAALRAQEGSVSEKSSSTGSAEPLEQMEMEAMGKQTNPAM